MATKKAKAGEVKKRRGRVPATDTKSPFSPRYRAAHKVQTVESVAAALRRYKGNYSAVARAHGVTVGATSQFILAHAEVLEPIAAEARRTVIDHVEYNLFDSAEQGDRWAMEKVLDCLARDRGYGRQMALTGPIEPDGTAGPVQIQIVLPDNFRSTRQRIEQAAAEVADEIPEPIIPFQTRKPVQA